MKTIIHYELPDGSEDQFTIEATTLAKMREKATEELNKRGGRNPLTEDIT